MRQIHRSLLTLLVAGVATAALGSTSSRLVGQPAVAGEAIPQVLRGQELRPLSLASGDFDGDGVPDLAAGFGTSEGGVVLVYRGNVDALYPNSPEARQRRVQGSFIGEPFLPMDRVLVLTAPPDFLFAGDFDADGHADLAAAARDAAAIHLLSGDGAGEFLPERRVGLPAGVVAMTSGDLGRRDGLPDLAVLAGPQALVFQAAEGALSAAPAAVRLSQTATSIAIGDFSADHRRRIALRGEDGRVLLLQSDAPRSWRLVEADPGEEGDSEDAILAPSAQSFSADAAAVLAMRVHPYAPSGDVVLKEDGTLSIYAKASLSTFVVNVTTDLADVAPGNGVCADVNGACSLRAAIQEANALAGADAITFAISGSGVPAIVVHSLPAVTEAVTIDGTTQAAGRVAITGTSNGTLITLAANGCVVRGMVLNGTGSFGLKLQSNDNLVEGNFFGTTADGTALQGNLGVAVIIVMSGANNRIGGTAASARNVVAGGSTGIRLDGGTTVIEGSYIGTDVTGTLDLGSTGTGIRVFTASGNTIGGSVPGSGNLVSGNGAEGISIETAGNIVQGNRVGTDGTGSTALPNQGIGIRCYFSGDATVGGTAPGMGNLMAGNGSHGLALQQNAVTNIVVQGNRIGTDLQGAYAISNQGYGIQIVGASQTLIGGTTAAARNLISGNLLDGIFFTKFLTVYPTGNLIQGNFIGTDATGTVAIPNLGSGVSFEYALGTLMGGASAGQGNVISGNRDHGIRFGGITDASANPNHVRGNLIGTNAFGTGALGNGKAGAFFVYSTPGYEIGGSGAGEANLIAHNAGDGIASASLHKIRFRRNSIHSNGGLAVDRSDDGVTPNAPPGTFVWENFPVLTAASTSASGTAVSGMLTSGYAETFTIHVFANPTCDASGYGEARQYLGATTVAATAGAATPFSTTVPTPAPAGSYITALAVAPDVTPYFAATSELSFCRQVGGTPPPGSVPLELYAVAPGTGGDTGSVTLRVAGQGIEPGATVRLVRAGQSDRVGTGVSISPEGGSLTATFALAGAAQGAWDIVVTNPDTTSATLPGAFQVEAGVEPEVWADILGRGTLVVRGGREQTFYLVFGNRGNTDAPATEFVVTIPWQLMVTFVEDHNGSRPVVMHDVPRTTGGSGDSTIRLFVPSLPANSSAALAFRVLTVAADPGEFGQEIEIRVWHLTSAILGTLIDIPIDPNIVLTPMIIDDTPDHLEWTVNVSDGTVSGDIHYEIAFTDVPFESDPIFVKTVTADEIRYDFSIALFPAAPLNQGIVESPRGDIDIWEWAGKGEGTIKGAPEILELIKKLAPLAMLSFSAVSDRYLAEAYDLPLEDVQELIQQIEGNQALQSGQVPSVFLNLTTEQFNSLFAALEAARSKKLCGLIRKDPEHFAELLGIPVDEVNAKSCQELEERLKEQHYRCPTNGPLSPACDAPKVRRTHRPLKIYLAIDPNEKAGPGGAGVPHYVTGADPLPYTVTFENLETATAAAQEVVVTDQLDSSKLEFSTFELGPIAFGTHVVDVPPGLTAFTGDVDLRPGIDLIARVSAGFDPNTGIATWHFFSLDPATGQPTSDPILGFLPPNVNSPEGEGHVSFTIDAKSGLATGTEIHNLASIVFDANPAIVTADWFNTIDVTAPTSQVAALPASSCTGILVAWSGTDAHSGIAEYDVFASQDGGQWFRWIQGTTSTSRTFYGSVGSTYAFYSIARDAAGNEEAPPGGGDATTAAGSPTPLVDSLTPSSGPAAGATVALTGSGFEAGASVTVGGAPASGETVTDPTSMTASFPALAAGALYDVVAANASTCADTLTQGWLADFNDVPDSHGFHDYVEKIFRRSVTAGCSGGNYCPDNPVTRAQMAVFLIKAKHNLSLVPPTATGTLFGDVPVGSFAADWIEQLANEGVTGGCGGGNYCPGSSVTRAQMAVFLLKSAHGALYVPPTATGTMFLDVPVGSFAADWIEQLANEGITGGCGGGYYCPSNPVTRGQMAVFLSLTFGF